MTEQTVTRTYRAAIRSGEDYTTIEETVTLLLGATDEDVALAVDLGWRIYRAQQEAIAVQMTDIRSSAPAHAPMVIRDPDAPASDKQRNYIATLQDQIGWSSEQLAAYASEQQADLVSLTRGQASTFIDGLKRLAEEAGRPTSRILAKQTTAAPKTVQEAERRFFARYGEAVGGNDWTAVQKYLVSRAPRPATIDGWFAVAEAVRSRANERAPVHEDRPAVDLSDEWNEIDKAAEAHHG